MCLYHHTLLTGVAQQDSLLPDSEPLQPVTLLLCHRQSLKNIKANTQFAEYLELSVNINLSSCEPILLLYVLSTFHKV